MERGHGLAVDSEGLRALNKVNKSMWVSKGASGRHQLFTHIQITHNNTYYSSIEVENPTLSAGS